MGFIIYLSSYIIPFVILYIIATGMVHKVKLFDEFVEGAKDGMHITMQILPTLVGLMMAIGIIRCSGALDVLTSFLAPITSAIHFPAELLPLATIKMFSSSAATSLLLDVYKEYGCDSYLGTMASLMMASSETIFYTLSVYFLATGDKDHRPVTKMRWTLAGCLFATLAGLAASAYLASAL